MLIPMRIRSQRFMINIDTNLNVEKHYDRRWQAIVDEPSFGTKAPNFTNFLKTFVAEGCTFKNL